jgi:hypothetical protein
VHYRDVDLSTLGWVTAIVVIVAIAVIVVVAVLRRGHAEGKAELGPLTFSGRGGAKPKSMIQDVESEAGKVDSASSGDSSISRAKAKKDITSRAGIEGENQKKSG